MTAPYTLADRKIITFARIDYGKESCLRWIGSHNGNGYGVISTKGNPERLAHRLVWTFLNGPIPDGQYIDHLCRNRGCVNVDHMELVTFRENVLRGIGPTAINARKTHCIYGHEFTKENTMPVTHNKGRKCRTCHNKLIREKRLRKKAW